MHQSGNLGEDSIKSLFFRYYLPALGSLLSTIIHQVINGIILAGQTGKEGVAVIGLFGPVITVFIALALPLMIGSGIMISRTIGARNYSKAQEIFQYTTTLAIVAGGLVMLSAPLITAPIARLLAGEENRIIVENLADYMFWGFIWIPFFFLRMVWGNFVSNNNAPKVSRNASLISVFLNVILDILLVVVFSFGTAGASVATGISVLAGTIYLFIYIKSEKRYFGFDDFKFTLRLKEWKELLNFGIPSFISELSFSAGLLMINKSLIPYGSLAVSAFGLVNYLSFIFLRLFTAAMLSVLPIISFNIGAKLPRRVLSILKFALLFTFLLGCMLSAIAFISSDLLVVIFSENETEEFRRLAAESIGLYFMLFIAAGPNYVLSAYLQAIGKSVLSIIMNVLKGAAFVGLFLFLLPTHFGMEVNGIWLSRSFTEIFTLLVVGLYTFCDKGKYYSAQAILQKSS